MRRPVNPPLRAPISESREGREGDQGKAPFAAAFAALVDFARTMIWFIRSNQRMAARQVVAAARESAAN
jgi:hypothetical protein